MTDAANTATKVEQLSISEQSKGEASKGEASSSFDGSYNGLSLEERFALVRSVGEEVIQEEELLRLLKAKPHPTCYDGFEPSGRMHIAQGIMRTINVNRMTKAGCNFIFWVADWFALLNNKMGGDLKKIRTVGAYMIEVWKACGMDMSRVEFRWAAEDINRNANDYWMRVMDIARKFNVPRIKRCAQIMGRKDEDDLSAAQILYPCMQCADIFYLKADICQLGMDQRKVNMLAREYCDEVKIKYKPVIVSHHMLAGLKEGQEKMSKSDPDSAIFMEDSEADVNSKIKKAFCPPGVIEKNPIMEYIKYVIFPSVGQLSVERKEENGGNKLYKSYDEIVADYVSGALHPGDVKASVAKALNALIQPVRDHFTTNEEAKKLLHQVRQYKTTR
jgi:tyrosyl-tRNA synthetase